MPSHLRAATHRAVDLVVMGVLSAAMVAIGAGCQPSPADDPRLRERIVSFDAPALKRLLAGSAQLDQTPLASASRQLLGRIEACDEVWARVPDTALAAESQRTQTSVLPSEGQTPLDAWGCLAVSVASGSESGSGSGSKSGSESGSGSDSASESESESRSAAATRPLTDLAATLRGAHDGLLLWPLGDDGRVEMRMDVDARGGLEIEGLIIAPSALGALALFVPDAAPPAPAAIAPSKALVHAHVRPAGGLQLASWIPQGSQGDRLFALKGRLLEGALLSGTWELALVPPARDGRLPLAVGALHHRLAAPVREALDEALDQLEQTWPILRQSRSFTQANGTTIDGGCYADLPLLPELAPCWVVTPDALLIGYRDAAIESVLAAPAVSASPMQAEKERNQPPLSDASDASDASSGADAQLDVYFDRLAMVDRAWMPEDRITRPTDLYERLSFRWRAAENGQIRFDGRLEVQP